MKPYNINRFGFAYMQSDTPTALKLISGNLPIAVYDKTTRTTIVNDVGLRLHEKVILDFIGCRSRFDIPKRTDIIVRQLADSRKGFKPSLVYAR